jgi:predicted alternative tryptophan synthase beta-subunit
MQPIGPDDLAPLFPMALILQEVSTEREVPIPEPVRDVFKLWRPSPSGCAILAKDPNHPGSLGIVISAAVEPAVPA